MLYNVVLVSAVQQSESAICIHIFGLSWCSVVKILPANARDTRDAGLISGLGKSPGEGNGNLLQYSWASLVVQTIKNPPAMQEIWVPSLGQEDPLEEGMASHSSILAWRIPWTEEPGGLQSVGSQSWTRLCD